MSKREIKDLSALESVRPAPATFLPTVKGTPTSNPVAKHYLHSKENGNEPGKFEAVAGDAVRIVHLFRKAAHKANYGVRVQVQTDENGSAYVPEKQVKDLDPATRVWIAFAAKPKQPRTYSEA